LRAIGKRVIGVVVDFDEEAIGAGGDSGAGHGRHFVAAAGAVRRIRKHRKMRKFFDDRDGGDVEGVAGVGFKGADAALAENDVEIAAARMYSALISSSSIVADMPRFKRTGLRTSPRARRRK